MKIFRDVTCSSVVDGVILEWRVKDECRPRGFQVYANNIDRQVVINSPILQTGRCYIKSDFSGLSNTYQVKVTLVTGESEISEELSPQAVRKEERRLLTEIRKREITYMKSHPFGSYTVKLFLKNQYGLPCELCGSAICSGAGGNAVDPGCPVCLGTGMNTPYYIYPKQELMLAVTPKDDKLTGAKGVQRNVVTRSFRSVCPLYLREDDILMLNNEAYVIKNQEVTASVGNTPVVYTITCVQLPTDEPRYPVLRDLSKRSQND
jgi:hypothetical protein